MLMFTGLSTCIVVWNALCFDVYWVINLYGGLECVVFDVYWVIYLYSGLECVVFDVYWVIYL